MCARLAFFLFWRLLLCSVTILPSSICKIKKAEAIGGCHDCIFSGHSSISLLLSYYIFKCFPDDVTKYSLLLYNVICGVAIIATRNHYTIDVLVAWLAVFALKSLHSSKQLKRRFCFPHWHLTCVAMTNPFGPLCTRRGSKTSIQATFFRIGCTRLLFKSHCHTPDGDRDCGATSLFSTRDRTNCIKGNLFSTV